MATKQKLQQLNTTLDVWIDDAERHGDHECRNTLVDLRDLVTGEIARLSAVGRRRKFATDAERIAFYNRQRPRKAKVAP